MVRRSAGTERAAPHGAAVRSMAVPACVLVCLLIAACTREEEAGEQAGAKQLSAEEQAQLRALGYVAWSEIDEDAMEIVGVVLNRSELSYKGVNYYCEEGTGKLRFVGMKGDLLHSIQVDVRREDISVSTCGVIEFDGIGGVVTMVENSRLLSVDLASKERWRKDGEFHHDLDISDSGTILALSNNREKILPQYYQHEPIIR